MHSYLSNRKQRVQVGSAFSEWLEIKSEVPQGSVFGPSGVAEVCGALSEVGGLGPLAPMSS